MAFSSIYTYLNVSKYIQNMYFSKLAQPNISWTPPPLTFLDITDNSFL